MKLLEKFKVRGVNPEETARTLDRVRAVLAGLNASSEREFLGVLGRLRDFQTSTLGIVSESAKLFEVSSDEDWIHLKRDLPVLLGEAASSNRAEKTISPLAAAERGLRKLQQRAGDLRTPVRLFRVLSVTTRIESERLSGGALDFEGLASEVDRLSGDLDEKAARIGETCSAGLRVVSAAVRTAGGAGRAERESLPAMIGQAQESLLHLTRNEQETADLLVSLTAGFEAVSADLADLAGSSQYQDIARQRIEHIAEALEESTKKLRRGDSNARGQAAANAKLQAAQFSSCWEDLASGRSRMIGALERIAAKVTAMASETARLLESGNGSEKGFFTAVALECGSLAEAVNRNVRLRGSVEEAAQSVALAIGPMREFIAQIEEIGERMRRISLNAHVKAARLAEQGAAMSSVADAIQKTAVESAGSARLVVDAINALSEAADTLEDVGKQDQGLGIRLAEGLARVAAHLNQREAEAEGRTSRILEAASELAADLQSAVQSLAGNRAEADVVAQCLDQLGSIARQAPGIGGLGRLTEHYAMDAERRIHRATQLGAPPLTVETAVDNVELF